MTVLTCAGVGALAVTAAVTTVCTVRLVVATGVRCRVSPTVNAAITRTGISSRLHIARTGTVSLCQCSSTAAVTVVTTVGTGILKRACARVSSAQTTLVASVAVTVELAGRAVARTLAVRLCRHTTERTSTVEASIGTGIL